MRHVLYTSLVAVLVAMGVADVSGMMNGYWTIMASGPLHIAALIVLLAAVMGLWLVRPPRPIAMRVALGVLAVITIGVVSYQTLNYGLGALDGLVGIVMAVVLGVEALEAPARQVRLATSPYTA